MARKAIQIACVALGAIGLIGVIICCALPEWLVGYEDDKEVHAGLWEMCIKQETGPQKCGAYDESMITSQIQACRALTIISFILCGLSLLLLIFGSDFTPCVQNQDAKPKMIKAAAVGLIVAGMLVIIPVRWFSNNIGNEGVMLGASIYVGYIAGVLMILSGVLLCYLSRSRSSNYHQLQS
ncbi:PREDICTED: claudin-4-like [Poecilia mexicana]|uniref:claudin-4-like n=1 Tax=Poecilia mexicana TaxID=48701 RepID=UPI00072DC58D|nr:PREDICTED: claudin-4-like [Poecilia mexicana]